MATLALLLGAFAVAAWAQPPVSRGPAPAASAVDVAAAGSGGAKVATGRELFETGCSSCHGFEGEGVKGQAPSLVGAGEAAADFYLRTGRMPLDQVGEEPLRGEPRYSSAQIEALVAYVGSLGPGPTIPDVDPSKGSVSEGMELFTGSCAGCHGIGGKGGVAIGGYAPPLGEATPTEVGEAVRVGPYVMPRFSERTITPEQLNSIAAYVALTQEPEDAGGFGIGHIGPVPEGLVAWLAALAALLLVARLIGERLGGGDAEDDAEEPR
ncbi:MAG TPA: c-type cytochrome [Solirubrobacterales bacterium]|nr:c-type cytochrome [Solirubrobacterales bacterium]